MFYFNFYAVLYGSGLIAAAGSILLNKRSEEVLYKVCFIVALFITASRYYFGVDMTAYSAFYESVSTISNLTWAEIKSIYFDSGFVIFGSLMKSLGFSFWGMTAVIEVILFYSIYKFIAIFPRYKGLIFCAFVIFNTDLYLQQLRQSLAVAVYLWFLISVIKDKGLFKCIILALLASAFHFSCIIPSTMILLLSYTFKKPLNLPTLAFAVLPFVLVFFLIVNFEDILIGIAPLFSNPALFISRVEAHFGSYGIAKSLTVLMVFPLLISTVLPRAKEDDRVELLLRNVSFCGFLFFAVFFKYDLFIPRIMTYFVPYCYSYVIYKTASMSSPISMIKYKKLFFQICACCLLVYGASKCQFSIFKMTEKIPSSKGPSILSVVVSDSDEKKEIKKKQFDDASYFWSKEYPDFVKDRNEKSKD